MSSLEISTRTGGWRVSKKHFKDKESFEKYACLVCHFLLRCAVQSANCGHWYCEACIASLLETIDPVCPNCDESLKTDEDDENSELYYPDKFVRRDIDVLEMFCLYRDSGCQWEGTFGKLAAHLKDCEYSICETCKERLSIDATEHNCINKSLPNPPINCPFTKSGCKVGTFTSQAQLEEHMMTQHLRQIESLMLRLASLESEVEAIKKSQTVAVASTRNAQQDSAMLSRTGGIQQVEADGLDSGFESGRFNGSSAERDNGVIRKSGTGVLGMSSEEGSMLLGGGAMMTAGRQAAMQGDAVTKLKHDVMTLQREVKDRNEEIASLRMMVNKLEKAQRSKTADFEDRDFRLSLIENSNHDGSMVWKIPQFSQRMDDAKSGKYTSIFSLPFYTGRYGYKMCLRLYILGDGIGKGSYMSLFFVLMKGEFDNILQWPFTHKVTFKLINQNSGRDVIDTFQPDPMSSSFRKPKSDMNIASGCPRFVTHANLTNGGFIADDTIFIKCMIDTATIKHP